jgi:hypothetical protein
MSERIHRPYMDAAWFALLEAAVASHPRKRAGVADDMGISRTTISQIMSGTYGASPERPEGCSPDKIARAVIDHYDRPDCPLVGRVIDRPLCRKTSLRPQPRGGDALARWQVCQQCPHKPAKETP